MVLIMSSLRVFLIGCSLGYTDGKVPGLDEVIKLLLFDGKVIGTILENVHGITRGVDVRTYPWP